MAITLTFLISGCQSEPVISSKEARDREYIKAFINEFGSVGSEKWLDASRTTLTVISKHSNPVRVYYTTPEGERVLVGDLTIRAGREEVPFMVPSGVTTLIVDAPTGEYMALVGSELNLDTATPGSRISRASDDPTGANDFRSSYASRRVRFKPKDVMPVYWEKFPEGKNNLTVEKEPGIVEFWGGFYPKEGNWMLYPVYWKWGETPDYQEHDDGTMLSITRAETLLTNSYFAGPMLRFITGFTNIISSYDNVFGTSNTIEPDKDIIDYTNMTQWIQSQGICLGKANYWTPNIYFGKSKYSVYTDFDQSCMDYWANRFWNISVSHIYQAYQKMVVYMPKNKSVTIRVPNTDCKDPINTGLTEPCAATWKNKTIENPIFIGINHPPQKHMDENKFYLGETNYAPDFNDIVFLLVPDDSAWAYTFSNEESFATVSTSPGFTLAAEDLGGSLDWDFNDAVFRVDYVTRDPALTMKDLYEDLTGNLYSFVNGWYPSTYAESQDDPRPYPYVFQITVTPLAAGGTMPIYIAYHGKICNSDENFYDRVDLNTTYNEICNSLIGFEWEDGIHIVGEELHSWLGESNTGTPVNVKSDVADHQAAYKVVFYAYDDPNESREEASKEGAKNLRRFSVVVDKDKTLNISRPAKLMGSENTANKVNRYVRSSGMRLFEPNGQVYTVGGVSDNTTDSTPQIIVLYTSWAREGVNIKDAFNKDNPDADKSLVEKWLEGGSSPWYKGIDDLVTKPL